MKTITTFKPPSTDRVIENLKQFTNARIAIGHSGGHQLTHNWLHFQKDFAQAKDAVLKDLDLDKFQQSILTKIPQLDILQAKSAATTSEQFLTRPDLGRMLSTETKQNLSDVIQKHPEYQNNDILIVTSSGLSALAVESQAINLLYSLLPLIKNMGWSLAPIIISKLSRVAFADKVNGIFKAKVVIHLIGERPGLSSCDSMSIYFTYNTSLKSTDEERNCISNIHRNGLDHKIAAQKLVYLINKAFALRMTGVNLKDDFSLDKFLLMFKG